MITNPAGGSNDLQRVLQGAQLPALPQSAIKLLELSQNPDNGPAEFARPIEVDPGLAGQVLRFVNSSFFGFSHEISSVKMAITLVGIRTIKNFSLWSAVFSLLPNPKCGPFDLKNLWQDSLRRGLFARAMARQMGLKEGEEAFSAALLQDMAIPLLAKELPQEYLTLLSSRGEGVRLSDLEQQRFGWNHASAAARMARSWKMPETFACLLEKHVSVPATQPASPAESLAASVSLSALLPSTSDAHWSECAAFESAYNRLRGDRGLTANELLAQIDREFQEFAPLLKLTTPAKTLVAWYEESLAPSA
jgi:HD-like signal output (HDOD) protein